MQLRNQQQAKVQAEVFDSPEYWLSHELKALDEEIAMMPADQKSAIQALKELKRKRKAEPPLDLDHALLAINEVLQKQYGLATSPKFSSKKEQEARQELMLFSSHPHLRFLLQKRVYLNRKQEEGQVSLPTDTKNPMTTVAGGFQAVFLTDTLQLLNTTLTGALGFIMYIGEGIQGARDAYVAYKNEKTRQRKTRILTSALSFMLAGVGAGMSVALLAGSFGASVSAVALTAAPVLISGFLVGIYGLALWRNAYVLSQLKEEESLARKDYEDGLLRKNDLSYAIHALEKKKEALSIQPILIKQSEKQALSLEEQVTYEGYKRLQLSLLEKQAEFAQVTVALDSKAQNLKNYEGALFQAKRTVAFNAIGVASSALVLVAMALGASALIGASVASFGAVPLALMLVGVVVGLTSQVVDRYDTKNNFSLSRKLGAWFSRQWQRLTNSPRETTGDKREAEEDKKESPKTISVIYQKLTEEDKQSHLVAPSLSQKPAAGEQEQIREKPPETTISQEVPSFPKNDFSSTKLMK